LQCNTRCGREAHIDCFQAWRSCNGWPDIGSFADHSHLDKVNNLQVVTSQTTALGNEQNDIDIRRRQLDASVLLIKALGGDWNTGKLPKV
jgi:hypothetical protein